MTEIIYEELSEEEVQRRIQDEAEILERLKREEEKASARKGALGKLKKLGLTEEEIEALLN